MDLPVVIRADLEQELASLQEQRAQALKNLEQIEGAAKMVRHLLDKIERRAEKSDAEIREAEALLTPTDTSETPPTE